VKLFSVYAHSSIEASLKKCPWNSSHNLPPRFDAHRAGTQFKLTTTSTKHLFPAERSLLKLRSKQTRQTNNFSALFWGGFFSSTRWRPLEEALKLSQRFSPTRGMACARFHVTLVSQSYCWYGLTSLVGRFPRQVCYLCGLPEDVHQRDLPNAVTKEIFKTFQGQVSVNIISNIRSLPSEDHRWVMVTGILRAER